MAGAGYKLFNTGDVLTAAQVNTYLMQQTVMVFASSAARTSALSGVLAEGMVSYLQDTNTLEVYDGSAWVGATGDITGLTAGTGISISSATGPVPTITSDVATTFDAKGDLVVGTGADTFSKLTAGQNGESIVADSSTSTGLRYTAGNAVGNPVLNSAMQVWQRGTSFTAAGLTADRWQTGSTTGKTISRQVTGDTTNLPNIQYCLRMQRNSGTTGTGGIDIGQNFETVNSIPYAGKTVTLSFYARAGANYSATSSAFVAYVFTGTGTDQNVFTGLTGSASPVSATVTLTTTWQRFSVTGTIAASATQLVPYFLWTPTGTAGANDYADITGVQIDIGSVAIPFRTYSATLAGELAACQRYYWALNTGNNQTVFNAGYCASATQILACIQYPVTMRVAPTMVLSTGTNYWFGCISGGFSPFTGSWGIDNVSTNNLNLYINSALTSTVGASTQVRTNNASAGLAFQAEL